jgi:uncharacterized cysteine cluster protein YcgN (CxxCxxCC family)
MSAKEFWKTKKLMEMTREEWESLCDGCGRCCLIKFQDEDTEELFYTNVVCKYYDLEATRCTVYNERTILVPTCLQLNPLLINEINWMPKTCAYRLLAEGEDLKWWHPLVSGDPNTVHEAGISIKDKVISEAEIDPDEVIDHIME